MLCLFVAAIRALFSIGGQFNYVNPSQEGHPSEGSKAAVSPYLHVPVVPANQVLSEFEGVTVQVDGPMRCSQSLLDEVTNIKASALRLKRKVEIYQWIQTIYWEDRWERVAAGGRGQSVMKLVKRPKYYYSLEWSPHPVDSKSFSEPGNHKNAGALPLPTLIIDAKDSRLGVFRVGPAIEFVEGFTPV